MVVLLSACATGSVDPDPATLEHRPTAAPCAPSPVPPEPSCEPSADPDGCTSHADCTDGDGGLCGLTGYGAACGCTYDECTEDTDCAGDSACICGTELSP